jgi:peptide/nickel transport system substrate-binding protein
MSPTSSASEWTAQPDPSIAAGALQRGEVDWLEQPLLDLVPMQLRKMGLNIDFQVMDWGTMISRIAKKDPIDQGGWNLFCVTWAGLTVSNPGSSYPLRANGLNATGGWPTDEKLEALRLKWLDTGDVAEQQSIARQMQEQAFSSLPFIPLGQWHLPAAYSEKLTGIIHSPFSLFWNVKRS